MHKKISLSCVERGKLALECIKEKRLQHRQLSFNLKIPQESSLNSDQSLKANQFRQQAKKDFFKKEKIPEKVSPQSAINVNQLSSIKHF